MGQSIPAVVADHHPNSDSAEVRATLYKRFLAVMMSEAKKNYLS
jgi:hypothetical protein